jgi:peptide/nickel transport system permease protein
MAVEAVKQQDGAFRRFLKRIALLRESPVGMIGATLVLFWILVAIFAPVLSPYDPNENYVGLR